jgi:hypothetical protein
VGFVLGARLFDAAFFATTLRAGCFFRATDFFAELFFFFGFAIAFKRPLIDWRRKNGRLIKNISLIAQEDSIKISSFCDRTLCPVFSR